MQWGYVIDEVCGLLQFISSGNICSNVARMGNMIFSKRPNTEYPSATYFHLQVKLASHGDTIIWTAVVVDISFKYVRNVANDAFSARIILACI